MAFKAESDDVRDSLSFKLKKVLQFAGATVLCSDEYITRDEFVSKEKLVADADIIVVGVPHHAYRTLPVPAAKTLVDMWGVIAARSNS